MRSAALASGFFVASVGLLGCGSGGQSTASVDAGAVATIDAGIDDASPPFRLDASGGVDAAQEAEAAAPPPPIKIKHVVVIVKENHTFDNFFGSFPGVNGSPKDGNGVPQCPTGNVLSTGALEMQACQAAPDIVGHDLCHLHSCALADWDQGKLDGWSTAAGSDNGGVGDGDGVVYKQYSEASIPVSWTSASRPYSARRSSRAAVVAMSTWRTSACLPKAPVSS
jgi:phospholipase C